MTIDKLNNDLAFNEEFHKYWNVKYPNRKYTSVTTLIGKYHPHFDPEFWSRYKALQRIIGMDEFDGPVIGIDKKTGKEKRQPASEAKKALLETKKYDHRWSDMYDVSVDLLEKVAEDIRGEYVKANVDACERGTIHHLSKEMRFYDKAKHYLKEYEFGLDIDNEFSCEKHNFDLNYEHRILPEYLIYWSSADGILNMAGQIDMLIKDGNDIYLLDYKTNAKGINTEAYSWFDKKSRSKKTEKMHYPINHLDHTTYMHYTLQLSIYAWMLQRVNPEFNIKLLRLLHIDGEGVETLYDLQYLKEDVEKLMKHYKKQLKIDHFRDTGKML